MFKLKRSLLLARRNMQNLLFKGKQMANIADEKLEIQQTIITSIKIPRHKRYPITKYGGINMVVLVGREGNEGPVNFISNMFEELGLPVTFETLYLDNKPKKLNEINKDDKNIKEIITAIQRRGAALRCDLTEDVNRNKREDNVLCTELGIVTTFSHLKQYYLLQDQPVKVRNGILLMYQGYSSDISQREYSPVKGVVQVVRSNSIQNIQTFLSHAFELAKYYNRKTITIPLSLDLSPIYDGLFVKGVQRTIRKDSLLQVIIHKNHDITGNIIMNPDQFDTICCSERFGVALLSALVSVFGGVQLHFIREFGYEAVIFEPAEQKVGTYIRGNVGIFGLIATASNLLHYLGHLRQAELLETSLLDAFAKNKQFHGEIIGGKHCRRVYDTIIENYTNLDV